MKRKDIENETRKNSIIETAEKLFLKKGYFLTTMDEIAELSEFSKPTIYKYFLSKEDIAKHVHLKFLIGRINFFLEAISTGHTPYDRLFAFGIAYYEYAEKHLDEFRLQLTWDTYPSNDLKVSENINKDIRKHNDSIGSVIKNEIKKLMPDQKPFDEFDLHHTMVSFYASLRMMISHSLLGCSRENITDPKLFYTNYLKLFLRGLEK